MSAAGGFLRRHPPLERAFYRRDPRTVARDLLGRLLVHAVDDDVRAGRIVETEAYCGPEDKAAHVAGSRRTARTEIFWAEGGHAYVYLIYGMHECFNVVTEPAHVPSAVLVRAVHPTDGLQAMAAARRITLPSGLDEVPPHPPASLRNLTSGPGKLCKALGIDREHYGHDLVRPPLWIAAGEPVPEPQVRTTPRIGIDYAEEYADKPWRYVVHDDPFLSKR